MFCYSLPLIRYDFFLLGCGLSFVILAASGLEYLKLSCLPDAHLRVMSVEPGLHVISY